MLESPVNMAKAQTANKPVKIVAYGSPGSGKTTLVHAIDPECRLVGSTESGINRLCATEGMFPTYVSFDLGIVNAGIRKVYVYGAPGNSRLKIAMSIISADMDVGLIIVDATRGITVYEKHIMESLKASKTPFIVLANKMDMPEASIDLVLKGLEDDVPLLPLSAKDGYGLDMLWNAIQDMIGIKV